ncbi:hypothetical protein, partial [Brachyspira sp.]|uniref:hypothetical protein n=1 Tax=Brachyspira sp. TaxID=1977261 RepID=UPI003D7E6899
DCKMKKIALIFILFSNLIFAADFQTYLRISTGANMTFSTAEHSLDYSTWKDANGFRVDNLKNTVNILLSVGYNHKIKNDILTSISVLAETGYNFSGYGRPTDKNFGEESGTVYFHSLVLGLIPTLNFHNDLSLGIGAGVMFPLSANITDYWDMMGDYEGAKKLSFKDIKSFYKVPIMPYIKFRVNRYFKYDKIDLITGGVLTYNFGMICESDKLANNNSILSTFSYKSYKFSALSLEVFLGFGFGRPK